MQHDVVSSFLRGARWRFALAAALWAGGAAAAAPPAFVERPCDMPVASAEVAARLRCGTVQVPRDPSQAADGLFDLAVVVKRSANPRAGALPVLILHGGPGGQQTPYMGRSSSDHVEGHDSITFDMRGGGRTGPSFCEELPAALRSAQKVYLQGRAAGGLRVAAIAQCATDFKAKGLKATHFGTERNVEDAEAVRQALAIDRWVVYAMSYGTTVAAEYVKRFPAPLAAVVLDSPYPPDTLVPSVREAQGRAIDQVLRECRADARCAARFGHLERQQADSDLQRLQTEPIRFKWQGDTYQADETTTRAALHGLFYSEVTAHTVPWFLDALRRKDGAALTAVLAMPLVVGNTAQQTGNAMGTLIATDCRDRPRHHVASPDGGPTWMAMLGGMPPGSCAAWPLGLAPQLPSDTNVPVLTLTAAYDGFQPDGAAMARTMGPNAQAIAVPKAAHVVRGAGACPRGLVTAFLSDPKAPLKTDCLDAMAGQAFLIDAQPAPELALIAPRLVGGSVPWPLGLAGVGLVLWLVAGLGHPLYRWARLRGVGPAAGGSVGKWAVVAGGVTVVGALVPAVLTVTLDRGAAVYGLALPYAALQWALPLGAALGLGVGIWAVRGRSPAAALAALGALLMQVAAWALGLGPW